MPNKKDSPKTSTKTSTKNSLGKRLLKLWQRLSPLPGGKWLFSKLFGIIVPYTGSIGARIIELRPGYSHVELSDRRKVRNHLNCVHAIALINLGEFTSGLALLTGLQPGVRGIVTGLSIEYFKKARGRLTAITEVEQEQLSFETEANIERQVYAEIKDQNGDLVARSCATWQLGPTP